MAQSSVTYRGRFAPSPSGPLHLGSLLTALASWLKARQAGGEWWLRIDDLDQPRCVPGADSVIQAQLEAHGLLWHGAPVYQSNHIAEYQQVLERLDAAGLLYRCTCTRAQLAATSVAGPDGPVYPGTCRDAPPAAHARSALRFRSCDGTVQWQDGVLGRIQRDALREAGDFVLRRADGQMGYHLACVVDEARMGITEVVRGADLLGATVQQRQLMRALALPIPRYAHLPVLTDVQGRKLSKQNGAAALQTSRVAVAEQLHHCLHALRLSPPSALRAATAREILDWALEHGALAGFAPPPA